MTLSQKIMPAKKAAIAKTVPKDSKPTSNGSKRAYLSQSDVPNNGLSQALRIPKSIFENYGGHASTPLEVAEGIDMTPTSGGFRNLCGASLAFGLTEGGYNAAEISVTSLGRENLQASGRRG